MKIEHFLRDFLALDRAIELNIDKYDSTIEKHQILEELIIKYYPEGKDDIFGMKSCTD